MSQKKYELEVVKFKKIVIIAIAILLFVFGIKITSQKEVKETIISKTNLNKQNQYEVTETSTNTATDLNGITWNYTLDENGNAINVYYESGTLAETVTIPETLDGHAVVELYNSSVDGNIFTKTSQGTNTTVKKVIIPSTLIKIGDYAFDNCRKLTDINIVDRVTSIGEWAFYQCFSLVSIEIPNSVKDIKIHAFDGCEDLTNIIVDKDNVCYVSEDGVLFNKEKTELIQYPTGKKDEEYTIPSSVTSIGISAFSRNGSLISVNIPISVISVEYNAFYNCTSLVDILVNKDNQNYASEDGVLFNKEKTELVQYPTGRSNEEYIIPSSVTSIAKDAFARCSLTSIDIPNSVTSIGSGAFYYCNNLTSINIPNSVTSIGNIAFLGCNSLTIYTNSEYVANYAEKRDIKYIKTALNIKITGNSGVWVKGDIVLKIVATSSESGIASITVNEETISLNNGVGSYTVTENGTYTVVATDNVGNIRTETVEVNKIDKTVPIINSITKSTEQEEVEILTLTVNAVDNESGISGYSWNNEQTWETSNEYEVRRNGTYTVKVKDKAGNISTKSITVSNIKETEEAYFALNNYEIKEKEETSYVVGISSQTSISDFKQYIQTNMEYSMVDKNENTVNDNNIVATGMKIKVSDGKQYILVLKADLNSDGKADITDLGIMARYVVGKGSLNSTYLLAGDLNKDNTVDITDVSILAMAITRNIKL